MEETKDYDESWREFVHKAWEKGETIFSISKIDGEKRLVVPYTKGNRLVWSNHDFVVHICDTDLGI